MSGYSPKPVEAKPLNERLIAVAADLLTSPTAGKLPTMRQIAASANVAPGAAYRHFESQNDLFFAVIERLFAELEQALTDAAGVQTTRPQKIGSIGLAYVRWGLANPGGYQLLFETTDDDEMMRTGRRPGREILDTLAVWLSPPGLPSGDMLHTATLLWIALHGLTSLRLHKTGMDWSNSLEDDVDKIVALVIG